jgi:hypothetical protein
MTKEEYIKILKQHGRRVANRVALASMPSSVGKSLADFYMCYAPEDDLPSSEHARTNMINVFDPTGWHLYYTGPKYDLWPEPPTVEDEQT